MPAERLERVPSLRAIVNVEGNFVPNVDYAAALDRAVHVLNASPAFALPVAEMAVGMAIDLARPDRRRRPRHAVREAFLEIGRLAVADLEPGRRPGAWCYAACRRSSAGGPRAESETAGRLRSRPVDLS